jgi:hypothetical protein
MITVLSPVFRYSHGRNAYVLRGIGARRGPVLTPRRDDLPRFTKDRERV